MRAVGRARVQCNGGSLHEEAHVMSETPADPRRPNPFEELFAKARTGDRDARLAFFERFALAVKRVIRHHMYMNPELRSLWDSDDFMQRTRMQLFIAEFQELDFGTPKAFLAYMMRVAQREVQQAGWRSCLKHRCEAGTAVQGLQGRAT
jgi:hypothetical protein